MRETPKNLFRFLIVLNIGAVLLLGLLVLGSFLWGGERLDSEMKAFFGEKTEFVNAYDDKYIYRSYSRREPENAVLFWVEKKDPYENNFIDQMMKQDALAFWKTAEGDAYFVNQEGTVYTLEQGAEAYQLEKPVYLSISCDSWEELEACAKKMEEWADYALEDKRYFWNYIEASLSKSSFSQFEVRIDSKALWIDASKLWSSHGPGPRFAEELTELLRKEYAKAFPDDPRPKALEEERALQKAMEEKKAHEREMKEWIDAYDGDFLAECILEDSGVSYRLVALDYVKREYYCILIKSVDKGKSWTIVNEAPFGEALYGDVEITFRDESHGTIAGIYSDFDANQYKKNIYTTEDGGKSFVLKEKGQPL